MSPEAMELLGMRIAMRLVESLQRELMAKVQTFGYGPKLNEAACIRDWAAFITKEIAAATSPTPSPPKEPSK